MIKVDREVLGGRCGLGQRAAVDPCGGWPVSQSDFGLGFCLRSTATSWRTLVVARRTNAQYNMRTITSPAILLAKQPTTTGILAGC